MNFFKKFTKKSSDGKKIPSQTLLEKAKLHRQQFPEKWKQRKQEIEIRNRELLGFFEMDPCLKSYYKTIQQKRDTTKKREEERLKEPRKIKVQLQYNPTKALSGSTESIDSQTEHVFSATKESFFDHLLRDDDGSTKVTPELVVTVMKAKNFHNGIEDRNDWMQQAAVKVLLLPDSESRGHKIQTPYRFLTEKGSTRFEYKIFFRGYSRKQLDERTLLFLCKGKNEEDKIVFGRSFLCGEKGLISTGKKGESRPATKSEMLPLKEALDNPRKNIPLAIALEPAEENAPKVSKTVSSVSVANKKEKKKTKLGPISVRLKF